METVKSQEAFALAGEVALSLTAEIERIKGVEMSPDAMDDVAARLRHFIIEHSVVCAIRVKALQDYVKYLEDAHASSAGFLHVHNWHYDADTLRKGDELRAKIAEVSS